MKLLTRVVGVCASIAAIFTGYTYYTAITSTQVVGDQINPQYIEQSEGTAPYIIRLGDKENPFFCSGVVIGKEFALTAAHCVIDSLSFIQDKDVLIYDLEGNLVSKAKPMAVQLDRDIALLKGDFSEFKSILVDWGGFRLEEAVNNGAISCGFPSGEDMLCSKLFYAGNVYFQMKFVGGQLYPGQSGGPVVVYYQPLNGYILIGVNSAVTKDGLIVAPVTGARSLLWGR